MSSADLLLSFIRRFRFKGPTDPAGILGLYGISGQQGIQGVTGSIEPQGETGPQGATDPLGFQNYADFYAIMPPDNVNDVPPGGDVEFPRDGPSSSTNITRLSNSLFSLGNVDVYEIIPSQYNANRSASIDC